MDINNKAINARILTLENSFKNSFTKWKMLKDLSVKKLNKEFTNIDLSKFLNTQRYNPYFIEMVILLENKNILKVIKKYGRMKIYMLNQNNLMKFIEESSIYKDFAEYIHNTRLLYIDI